VIAQTDAGAPPPFRVAVLVSGEGTNLQAILDRLHGRGVVEVACVASNRPEAAGLERARAAGVPTGAFPASAYPDRAERDVALADWIAGHGSRLVVLAGFMELLSPAFVARFPLQIVNVHPSLLPAFRGTRAIEQAFEYGVKVMGVTVHFVDDGVDTGPIVLQRAFELPYPAGIAEIEDRVHEIEHELLPRAVELIAGGAVAVDPADSRRVLVRSAPRG
jgi:phosphoribosylglycinamide formyltransferase-1